MVTRGLNNLKAFLKKGEQWAEEKGMDKEKLLHAKLADDMKVFADHCTTFLSYEIFAHLNRLHRI